ncbi:MAG TPA: hypothetical protein VKO38_06425, partial [Wenzhouxiangella sp.]|nr:hypothetical protein [Wenzhouxiangella sp.]
MTMQDFKNWNRIGATIGVTLMVLLASTFAYADRAELRDQGRPAASERSSGEAGSAISEDEMRFYKGMPDSFREVYDPEGKLPVPEPVDARLQRIGDRTTVPEQVRPFIVDVTFDGAVPTMFFEIFDENGAGVADIDSIDVRMTAVKLAPGGNGKSPHWVGYVLRDNDGVENAHVYYTRDGMLENLGGGNY